MFGNSSCFDHIAHLDSHTSITKENAKKSIALNLINVLMRKNAPISSVRCYLIKAELIALKSNGDDALTSFCLGYGLTIRKKDRYGHYIDFKNTIIGFARAMLSEKIIDQAKYDAIRLNVRAPSDTIRKRTRIFLETGKVSNDAAPNTTYEELASSLDADSAPIVNESRENGLSTTPTLFSKPAQAPSNDADGDVPITKSNLQVMKIGHIIN